MSKWLVVPHAGLQHVVPVEDREPHYLVGSCHCHPEMHPETKPDSLIVHNAFDLREMDERDSLWGKPN